MANMFIRSVVIILIVNFMRSSLGNPGDKYREKCTIDTQNLKQLIDVLGKVIGENSFDVPSSSNSKCDTFLLNIINYSSILRNECQTKSENFEKNFNETYVRLLQEQRGQAGELSGISEDLKQTYGDIFKQTSSQIKSIRQLTEFELKNQAELGEALDYYLLFLSSNYEPIDKTAELCSILNEKGKKVLSIADEILVALTGERFDGDCERLSKKMMNVKSIIARSEKRNEGRLEILEKSFQERKRLVSKIIFNNEQGLSDSLSLSSNLTELQLFLKEIVNTNEGMKQEIEHKSFQYAVKIVQDGNNLWEAREILKSSTQPDAYNKALREALSCESESLYKVAKFAEISGHRGFDIILNKIIECNMLDHPINLKVQKVLKKEEFNENVEKIYASLSNQIRQNSTSEFLNVIERLSDDVVDLPRLIRTSYDKNVKNFMFVKEFIDSLDAIDPKSNRNLETVLYDEMMECQHVDTVQHVMFGFWLKKKLHQINHQTSPTTKALAQRDQLVELKKRLPVGIQNLFFEPYFIIANHNFTHLIRGFGYDSVKFVAIPSDEGMYFRIEDTKDKKALFRASIDEIQGVMVGTAGNKDYFWQIVPIANAQLFIIKSAVDGFAISSNEHKKCSKFKKGISLMGFSITNDECKQYDYYNLAFPSDMDTKMGTEIYDESQRWKITKTLIRNGLLDDRTKRI